MDIEKLENYLIFTEFMNFTAAANKAFMDTSVFHRQISSIEHELNIQLIRRDNRAMTLTPAGESFARGMRDVLELYHIEVEKAVSMDSGQRGTVRVCNIFGHSISPQFTAAISRFESVYPDIQVILLSNPMAESRVLLQKGSVDFTVARDEDYALIDDVEAMEMRRISAGYAVHADLLPQNVGDQELDESLLDRYPLIWCKELMSRQSGAYIEERIRRLGPGSVIFVNGMEATYMHTELKKGFTLINDLCYFRYQPGIRFFPSARFVPIRHSLIRKKTNANASAALLWNYMREQFPQGG